MVVLYKAIRSLVYLTVLTHLKWTSSLLSLAMA